MEFSLSVSMAKWGMPLSLEVLDELDGKEAFPDASLAVEDDDDVFYGLLVEVVVGVDDESIRTRATRGPLASVGGVGAGRAGPSGPNGTGWASEPELTSGVALWGGEKATFRRVRPVALVDGAAVSPRTSRQNFRRVVLETPTVLARRMA